MNPPSAGLDASWQAGLAMAVKGGLRFGTDVVFSYGPLGFLRGQILWYGDLAVIAFAYSAILYVAFCTALVWALRRALPAAPAVLVAFVISVLPLLEQSVLVAVLVCMGMLEEERTERVTNLLVIGGASFAAVEALVKLSTGPLIGILFLCALIGVRARWWQLGGFLALVLAEAFLFWLATGQSVAAIPAFLGHTWEVASGYNAAMPRLSAVAAWKVTAATALAIALTLGLVAASAQARYRDDRARWWGMALMGAAAFAVFKEGVVRVDAGHLSLYFSTACVLWVAIPWARARWPWMLAGVVAIVAMGLPVRPPGSPSNLDPIANFGFAADQARTLFSPSRRAELSDLGRESMKGVYAVDPSMLAELRGHTVAVEPWEVGAAWAYRLDWDPLPVFQNYSAYTSGLDRLNADAAADPAGPERILRENPPLVLPEFPTPGIDSRYPGWDPPTQLRAVLCHFVPLQSSDRWQVLGRTGNRCGPPRLVRSVDASPGTAVRVPAPSRDEVVFARVDGVELDATERAAAFLLRAPLRHATLDGASTYRLVPGTAGDGLLLRAGDPIAASDPFSQIPQAKTIAVTGASGGLRFDFFRMQVH